MYGNQHFLLTLFSVSAFLLPYMFFTGDIYPLIIIISAGVASLLPDVDLSDEITNREKIVGTSRFVGRRYSIIFNKLFGRLSFFVGKISRFLVYKPYNFLLNQCGYSSRLQHRSAFHTLPAAILTATIISLLFFLFLLW